MGVSVRFVFFVSSFSVRLFFCKKNLGDFVFVLVCVFRSSDYSSSVCRDLFRVMCSCFCSCFSFEWFSVCVCVCFWYFSSCCHVFCREDEMFLRGF